MKLERRGRSPVAACNAIVPSMRAVASPVLGGLHGQRIGGIISGNNERADIANQADSWQSASNERSLGVVWRFLPGSASNAETPVGAMARRASRKPAEKNRDNHEASSKSRIESRGEAER